MNENNLILIVAFLLIVASGFAGYARAKFEEGEEKKNVKRK